MIERLYINNFRCLQNFDLRLEGLSSVLLHGDNGSGKSSVARVLEIFQKIAKGSNRISELLQPSDFTGNNKDVPIRFILEVRIGDGLFRYELAFDLPVNFRELRLVEEKLELEGTILFARELAKVQLEQQEFSLDWHLIALPILFKNPQLRRFHNFGFG